MMMLRVLMLCLLLVVPAAAQTTRHLWIPVRPDSGASQGYVSLNGLHCFAWVAQDGITNATTIAWFMTAGVTGSPGQCSVSIYIADGSVQLATTGPTICDTAGGKQANGLPPFTLAKGNKYQICTCQSGSGGAYLGQFSGLATSLRFLQNSLTVPIATFGNNDCVSAVAPATTGGVFGPINAMTPIIWVSTGTP